MQSYTVVVAHLKDLSIESGALIHTCKLSPSYTHYWTCCHSTTKFSYMFWASISFSSPHRWKTASNSSFVVRYEINSCDKSLMFDAAGTHYSITWFNYFFKH